MYRRGKKGTVYISVQGVRQSSGTTDKIRAKALQDKLNAEAWDSATGLILPDWDRACVKWIKDSPLLASKPHNIDFGKFWKPLLTGKKLTAITPSLIHRFIFENRPGVSVETRTKQNATANYYVGYVSRIIRHSSNLKPNFQRYPPRLGNDLWTSPEDWISIASHLNADALDALTFSLATGLREANVMHFEWGWDHGTWGTVPASDTKTDKPYGVPFNKTAQAVLERRKAAAIKHVRYAFTDSGKPWYRLKILRALSKACKAAGLPVLTVHALRHTFGTWLARAGVPREVRQRLMAHSLHSVHDRYIHYDVESLRQYGEIIDTLLSQAADKTRKASSA